MGLKSLKDLKVEGVQHIPVAKVVDLFFGKNREAALDASNIPSMSQLKNMLSYDYSVAMLDNGNFAAVTGKIKTFEHNGTPLKTGLNSPNLSFPTGRTFIDSLMKLLNSNSLAELAKSLEVDEPILHFMSELESINSRFLIYVHLKTDIPITKLLNIQTGDLS